MNKKNNAGFSLVEVLVAIVILGILSAPVCTSLVLSTRMNVKATELLEAQLAVSSAVETLMAEGITGASTEYDVIKETGKEDVDRFPDLTVVTEEVKETVSGTEVTRPYFKVTVSMANPEISVTTYIRKAGGT